MLSKSVIQFSVDGRGCVLSLLFDLRPNYGGGNEYNGNPMDCSLLGSSVHEIFQASILEWVAISFSRI